MNKKLLLLTCLSLFFTASTYAQATSDTLYVDPSATGLNDGSSWANAYTNIVTAVDDAVTNGNTDVWVKQGTYVAPNAGDYTFISMNNGVHLYGGFDGTETSLNQRDPINNITILSGDVNQDDVQLTSVVDALDDPSRSDNNYSVITARPAQTGSIRALKIDGFTITGGNSRSTTSIGGWRYGGGIYVNPVFGGQTQAFNSVEIENCIFENNSAYYGSAILTETAYNLPTLAVIENCIFRNNFSQGNVVSNTADTHNAGTLITNCLFTENTVTDASIGLVTSGSLNSTAISTVNITNSTFADNTIASGNVLTVYAPSGGGTIPVRLNVYNSIISETTAATQIGNYGAGIADTITVRNNIVDAPQLSYSGSFAHTINSNNIAGQGPNFVGGGNYALANGSVAINHGTVADYNLWYNDPLIQFSSPVTGLGGNPIPTSGNLDAGAYQSTGVTGINENELQSLVLNLYPNPTQTQLNIEVKEAADIQIINLVGEIVATQKAQNGNNSIDVSHLTSGVYFLQVGNAGAVKFVKE